MKVFFIALLGFSLPAIAKDKPKAVIEKAVVQQITVTNNLIGEKKVWEPSLIKVKSGKPVELRLVNTLKDPHGFNAPGLADNVVVGGLETKIVKFTPMTKGTVKYNCQLHPPHVGGDIVVE
jgi:plastocyanin